MKIAWLKNIHLSMNGETIGFCPQSCLIKKSYNAKGHCTAEKVSFEW